MVHYNSFSGTDIIATFGGYQIAELQAVSHSTSREKAPIYTMGSANPRGFARGKRGIAGTLVFIMFDKHALLSALSQDDKFKFQADESEHLDVDFSQGVFSTGEKALPLDPVGQAKNMTSYKQIAQRPYYADQVPPFDIILFAANEYGATAKMIIHDVEILNEGSGVSIDDIVTEQQMTYVATGITHWHATNEGVLPKDIG